MPALHWGGGVEDKSGGRYAAGEGGQRDRAFREGRLTSVPRTPRTIDAAASPSVTVARRAARTPSTTLDKTQIRR